MTRKNAWGEDRVMYFDTKGKLRSMLASWTSLAEQDLFSQWVDTDCTTGPNDTATRAALFAAWVACATP